MGRNAGHLSSVCVLAATLTAALMQNRFQKCATLMTPGTPRLRPVHVQRSSQRRKQTTVLHQLQHTRAMQLGFTFPTRDPGGFSYCSSLQPLCGLQTTWTGNAGNTAALNGNFCAVVLWSSREKEAAGFKQTPVFFFLTAKSRSFAAFMGKKK